MSRTGRFLSGVSLGYFSQVLVLIAGLWLTPFLLSRLGQHYYGLWLLGAQILTYVMLLDFGIVALLPRETAYATGRADGLERATALREVVGNAGRLVLWQMPLVAGTAVLVWFCIPDEWHEFRGPFAVVLTVFVLTFPARVFQGVLQGLQDLGFLGAVQISSWLVGLGVTIGLVLHGFGLYALAGGWAVAQVIAPGACWWRLGLRWPGILSLRPSVCAMNSDWITRSVKSRRSRWARRRVSVRC